MAEMSSKKSVQHGNNKPKKSKNDLIRAAVGQYLKQRNYVGSEKVRKMDLMLLQNKKEFVFNRMVEGDLTKGNSFIYSNVLCISNNQHIVDQQFGKFSQFIEAQEEDIREELRRFYAPVLCHLYLELLRANEPKAALDFLKKNASLVAPVENYEAPLPIKINGCGVSGAVAAGHNENSSVNTQIKFAKIAGKEMDAEQKFFIRLVQVLSTHTKYDTAEQNEDVREFRRSKYELYISEEVFSALSDYLQTKGHVLIMNLIYTWLHVYVIDNEVRQWSEDYLFNGPDEDIDDEILQEEGEAEKPSVSTASKRPAETPCDQLKTNDELADKQGRESKVFMCLKFMQMCSEKICEAQTIFPRFVKVADQCRSLTSADLDQQQCHLAAGFGSSAIYLWQMNQRTVRGRNIHQRQTDSACKWELSNCFVMEEEDEIENAVRTDEESKSQENADVEEFYARKYEENSINDYGGIQLRGHRGGVTDVCFSSHYSLLYSTSKDRTVRCWRAGNYTCAAVYRGHAYPVWCVDESPVGMFIGTGSKDLTARLWSLDRETPFITYVGHTQDVECVAFHPNGNYIASGSADLSVRLWCVTSGKLMRVFSDCKQPVTSIAFSPDGKMLAAGGEETKIRIYDLAAGSQLTELKDLTASCTSIAWSAFGQHLAAACSDGTMRLWDVSKIGTTNAESGSNSTATNSFSAASPLLALSSKSQRLLKVLFSSDDTLSCIGN